VFPKNKISEKRRLKQKFKPPRRLKKPTKLVTKNPRDPTTLRKLKVRQL